MKSVSTLAVMFLAGFTASCGSVHSTTNDCASATAALRLLSTTPVAHKSEAEIIAMVESALAVRIARDANVLFPDGGAAYKWTSIDDAAEISIFFIGQPAARRLRKVTFWCSKHTGPEAVEQIRDWLSIVGYETPHELSPEAVSHVSATVHRLRERRSVETSIYERNNASGAVLTLSDFDEMTP